MFLVSLLPGSPRGMSKVLFFSTTSYLNGTTTKIHQNPELTNVQNDPVSLFKERRESTEGVSD